MKLPCKDCISFAMCNAQLKQDHQTDYERAYDLYRKCSILSKYLNKYHSLNAYESNRESGQILVNIGKDPSPSYISFKSVISLFWPHSKMYLQIQSGKKGVWDEVSM